MQNFAYVTFSQKAVFVPDSQVLDRFMPVKTTCRHGHATERYNSYDDHYLICKDRKFWKLLQFLSITKDSYVALTSSSDFS